MQTVAAALACSAASDHLLKNLDTYKPFSDTYKPFSDTYKPFSDTYKPKTYEPFSALKTKISDIVCLTTKAAPQHASGTGSGIQGQSPVTVACVV